MDPTVLSVERVLRNMFLMAQHPWGFSRHYCSKTGGRFNNIYFFVFFSVHFSVHLLKLLTEKPPRKFITYVCSKCTFGLLFRSVFLSIIGAQKSYWIPPGFGCSQTSSDKYFCSAQCSISVRPPLSHTLSTLVQSYSFLESFCKAAEQIEFKFICEKANFFNHARRTNASIGFW